ASCLCSEFRFAAAELCCPERCVVDLHLPSFPTRRSSDLVEHDIDVFVLPRVGDLMMDAARPTHMFHLSVLKVGRSMASPEYLFVKRAMDIVLSLIALLITSPFFLVISAAIKATDGGPVFYKQCRLTKDGSRFDIIKFRSMKVDAEKDGVARLSTGETDDRIT